MIDRLTHFAAMVLAITCLQAAGATAVEARPIGIKFKHSGGPPQCLGCNCPLGICIIVPFVIPPITAEQALEGYGPADVEMQKDPSGRSIYIVFGTDAALPDSTIPIPSDFSIGAAVAQDLGFQDVIVRAGIYTVDFSEHPTYGAVSLPVIVQPVTAPASSSAGIALTIAGLAFVGILALRRRSRRTT